MVTETAGVNVTTRLSSKPRPVLLVGSVPLGSATEVFETVGRELGTLVRRIPDGETGERASWISWQRHVLRTADGLEIGGERKGPDGTIYPRYKVRAGGSPDQVNFGRLGYADMAISSYAEFARLHALGKVPAGTRFQVSLPTPFAVVFAHIVPAEHRILWPIYERALLAEIDSMMQSIPPQDLSIQWDIAVEIDGVLEIPSMAKEYGIGELVDGIARVSNHVPIDAELGLHFCYGDPGHKHVIEPKDAGLMVELANRLGHVIRRPVTWVHMPVPRDRDDNAYFAPLGNLTLGSNAEFYLGLVHLTDGIEGARRRLSAATKVVANFGVATECGFGRRPRETIPALLALHRQIAELNLI